MARQRHFLVISLTFWKFYRTSFYLTLRTLNFTYLDCFRKKKIVYFLAKYSIWGKKLKGNGFSKAVVAHKDMTSQSRCSSTFTPKAMTSYCRVERQTFPLLQQANHGTLAWLSNVILEHCLRQKSKD